MPGNYVDHSISTRVSKEFKRVVTGKTDIVTMANGRDRRNAAWKFKKMNYTATFISLSEESREEIVSAFYACNAQLLAFRFRDYGDCVVEASPLDTSELIGTVNPVQLTKRYPFGPIFADRKIQAVRVCVVHAPGGAVTPGTFDTRLGLFTPMDAWGGGTYTWSGTFDLWVRFNSDELDATMIDLDTASTDIELMETEVYETITGS